MSTGRQAMHLVCACLVLLVAVAAFDGQVADQTTPNGVNYNNPYKMPCSPGEYNLTVQSIPGAFCSPTCSITSPCPALLPSGTVASPECVLQDGYGMHLCALICAPDNSAKVCGAQATCKPVQSTGICTYDP